MKTLSEPECRRWCRAHAIPLDDRNGPAPFSSKRVEHFAIPSDSGRRIALVKQQVDVFRKSSSVLVWIIQWGVWPSSERMHIFERFRLSYGIEAPLIDRPGHVLSRKEFEDTLSLVTLAALFFWDCYVLTPRNRAALFYSHDEVGMILR